MTIRISQQELSGVPGVSREIVDRQLAAWKAAGLIEVTRGTIERLDVKALRRAGVR
jgi:CRP-like cAMP-binding protein